VRLLRVLETGEFLKVGSSKAIKTNVRVVAATNVNIPEAINRGTFREDLYYRLNTISIAIPPLRDRKEDIPLLFNKFSEDISEKYHTPPIKLDTSALHLLVNYPWKGNIRQLKNVTEQISIVEEKRVLNAETLAKYLPAESPNLPMLYNDQSHQSLNERELLYSVLFDMKRDISELRKVMKTIIDEGGVSKNVHNIVLDADDYTNLLPRRDNIVNQAVVNTPDVINEQIIEASDINDEEPLSLEKHEKEFIEKALEKYRGKRKLAAKELGISERTLYRKIKEYDLCEINF
jgi:DNA-binding NtrC family response regulator